MAQERLGGGGGVRAEEGGVFKPGGGEEGGEMSLVWCIGVNNSDKHKVVAGRGGG